MRWADFSILPDDDSAKSIRSWRIRQAVIACSCWALMVFFVLPALIGVPFVLPKIGQVAWASDTQNLNDKLNNIEVRILSQDIQNAFRAKCDSQMQGKHTEYWTEHLRKLKSDYFRMTGQAFELPPSC